MISCQDESCDVANFIKVSYTIKRAIFKATQLEVKKIKKNASHCIFKGIDSRRILT